MNTTVQRIKMLKCPACGQMTLHPQRKALGYHVCINCSTAKPVVGITTVEGTGDHTWNDIMIMDRSTARKLAEVEARAEGRSFDSSAFDQDDTNVSQSINDKVRSILDPDDYVQDNSPAKEEKSILDDLIKQKPNG